MDWLKIARIYSKIYWYIHCHFHLNIKGLGYLLKKIDDGIILDVEGVKFFFSQSISGAYARIITGNNNEPETHKFLNKIMALSKSKLSFIDVGCNIGEFILDMSKYENISQIFGFEPDPRAIKILKKNIQLNHMKNVTLVEKVVNADGSLVHFSLDTTSMGSKIANDLENDFIILEATTLDEILPKEIGLSILMIDVEGAELLVMEGGKKYIFQEKPLIIFEFNDLSRKHFSLNDVRSLLGEDYVIYRLNQEGGLDKNFERTWNCVACSTNSEFFPIIQRISR